MNQTVLLGYVVEASSYCRNITGLTLSVWYYQVLLLLAPMSFAPEL